MTKLENFLSLAIAAVLAILIIAVSASIAQGLIR